MKVIAISDLHGYLPKDLPSGDILCICGDIVPLDYQNDLAESIAWFDLEFVPWTDSLPYKKVIFIAGNHDFFLEKLHLKPFTDWVEDANGSRWETLYKFDTSSSRVLKKLLPGNNKGKHKLVYLCDNSVEIEGKVFYGTPYIADLTKWAFYRENDALESLYNRIPKKCDVLLTHMPPKIASMGEVLQRGNFNTGADYGSEELAKVIDQRDIKYALCGHVHSGCHKEQEINGTIYANVSLKNEDYQPQYYPFEFDI